MIKPEYWVSDPVGACSPVARLALLGLLNFCDDAGNHPASPARLGAEVFPYDGLPVQELAEYVRELHEQGLLVTYHDPETGAEFWHVTGWDGGEAVGQKIDRPTARYPRYSPENADTSPMPRRVVGEPSVSDRPEEKGREGKRKKGKEKGNTGPGDQSASARPRFVPPTLAEVAAYCAETGRDDADAAQFCDYYGAQNWKLANGQKMADWRCALRNAYTKGWIRRADAGNGSAATARHKDLIEREERAEREKAGVL